MDSDAVWGSSHVTLKSAKPPVTVLPALGGTRVKSDPISDVQPVRPWLHNHSCFILILIQKPFIYIRTRHVLTVSRLGNRKVGCGRNTEFPDFDFELEIGSSLTGHSGSEKSQPPHSTHIIS